MEKTIDLNVLRKVVGIDPDMLCEVIQDFSMYAETGIAEIRAAVAREDVEQLKTTAHRHKGSVSLVGANQLLEVCTQLEIAADATDWPMTHLLMSPLDGLLHQIKKSAEPLVDAQPFLWIQNLLWTWRD